MTDYSKACDIINSCTTSRQNNIAFAYVLLYEKEMNRRNKVENGYSLILWNRLYMRIKRDVEALHDLCDDNLLSIIG